MRQFFCILGIWLTKKEYLLIVKQSEVKMKVENIKVNDLFESIVASKYPMAVDTKKCTTEITKTVEALAQSAKGEGHDQFLTGIRISFDLTCSNKMWVEIERYRFVEFVSSQSTMHRIARFDIKSQCNKYVDPVIVKRVEELKQEYLAVEKNEKSTPQEKAEAYLKLLYNVPSGFELTARLTTNYRALKTVYAQRKNHRLPEWRAFCRLIEELPYARQLIVPKDKQKEMGAEK